MNVRHFIILITVIIVVIIIIVLCEFFFAIQLGDGMNCTAIFCQILRERGQFANG